MARNIRRSHSDHGTELFLQAEQLSRLAGFAHLEENPGFIEPAHRQNQVLEFLKEPLNDLCISRPKIG